MSLETLDRTLWSCEEALRHIERVVLARRSRKWLTVMSGDATPVPIKDSELPGHLISAARRDACDEFLVALRDGYLRASGRVSTTPQFFPPSSLGPGWRLHRMDPSLITTVEWREGEFAFAKYTLTGSAWQYIDIEIPAFMVMAIWRETPDEAAAPDPSLSDTPYTTPYLALMQAAIREFGLTDSKQGKKELIMEWFLAQHVEGEPISNKLADAMSTLIRLPSAQRGGAKRMVGPDLRQVG